MRVSCIIPCYGGQDRLDLTLATLAAQTRPFDEIVVVDDGSEIPIVVSDSVRLVRLDRAPSYRGSSKAKNEGARWATGDYLVFSDNDILHLPDALESVLDHGVDDRTLINVPSINVREGQLETLNWTADRMEGLYASAVGDVGMVALMYTDPDNIVSSEQHFGFLSRRLFDRIGGYDAASFPSWGLNNQDFCMRVLASGGVIESDIKRVRGGRDLYCFHQWSPMSHAEHREPRDREFFAKYGRRFTPEIVLGRT